MQKCWCRPQNIFSRSSPCLRRPSPVACAGATWLLSRWMLHS